MTCRVSSIGPDGSRPRRLGALVRCDCSIADSCVTPAPDAITSRPARLPARFSTRCVPRPAAAPRARHRTARGRPAGRRGAACVPARGIHDTVICPVGRERPRAVPAGVVTDRTSAAPWFRRVPSAYPGYTHRRAPVETALPPAAPRRAYPRGAGGSSCTSTLAARHPPPASSPVVEPRRAFKRKPGRPHPDPRRTTDPGPTEAPCPRPGPRAPTRMKVVEDGRTMS
jgi:hypothetical protein